MDIDLRKGNNQIQNKDYESNSQICKNCQTEVSQNDEFCPKCGFRMQIKKFDVKTAKFDSISAPKQNNLENRSENGASTSSVVYWKSDNDTRAKFMMKRPGSVGKLKRLNKGQSLTFSGTEINLKGSIIPTSDIKNFHIFNRLAGFYMANIIEISFHSRPECLYIGAMGRTAKSLDNFPIQKLFKLLSINTGQRDKISEMIPYEKYIEPKLSGLIYLLFFLGVLPVFMYLYYVLSQTEDYAKKYFYIFTGFWVLIFPIALYYEFLT